jgi:hypothetical protein
VHVVDNKAQKLANEHGHGLHKGVIKLMHPFGSLLAGVIGGRLALVVVARALGARDVGIPGRGTRPREGGNTRFKPPPVSTNREPASKAQPPPPTWC